MFQSCYTPVDIAHLMRYRYGFPVELADCRPVLVCGTRIGAIDTPAHLGNRVLTLLHDEPSVPIVGDSRDRVWTFLVKSSWPPPPGTGRRQRRLAAHDVMPRPGGHRVLLPVSAAGPGWHWVSEPVPGPLQLPARTAVLAAADLAIDLTTGGSMPGRRAGR